MAIIGIVVIAGVYLFSVYQSRLRRQAAIKTFTHDELDEGVEIADERLRDELSHINTMLEQEVSRDDISEIKINPSLDGDNPNVRKEPEALTLPALVLDIAAEHRIVHALKSEDNRLCSGAEIREALNHTELAVAETGLARTGGGEAPGFMVAALNQDGSLANLDDPEFSCYGLLCYFNAVESRQPIPSYELMLKKIDLALHNIRV